MILGGLLLAVSGGSIWYIDRLQDNIAVLKANEITLKTEIAEQNESIKNYLENQEKNNVRIAELTKKNQESLREVNRLKNTFARHDLDNLALAKPQLIENIINKGTKKVKEELIALTDPDQFDKKENEESTDSN